MMSELFWNFWRRYVGGDMGDKIKALFLDRDGILNEDKGYTYIFDEKI